MIGSMQRANVQEMQCEVRAAVMQLIHALISTTSATNMGFECNNLHTKFSELRECNAA